MAVSYASTVIDAPADEVWAHIRDFNGLATWHSAMVTTSEIEEGKTGDQVGAVRSFTLANGSASPGAPAQPLRRRARVHLQLRKDAVRRRQLQGHAQGQPGHRRE